MPVRTLTSKANPLVRTIRLVAGQSRRAPADLVLAEGVRVLEEALAASLRTESVVVSEDFGSAERESAVLRRLESSAATIYRAPDTILNYLSGVQTPPGILALVRLPFPELDEVTLPANALVLCACGVQDPGNLGTLIRTSAAAGVSLFCSLAGTVSARNPKAVRASAGAVFRMPVVERITQARFEEYCLRNSITVLCASAHGGTDCFTTDFTRPCAILLGNEGSGIHEQMRSGLPCVHVPMKTGVESLNVAAAGAVLLFEALRQRSQIEEA